jgi:hypothetical protein
MSLRVHRAGSPPLDPFYYLNNFESVLASLLDRYADLLAADERAFIAAFPGLPKVARALLVRMAMRKGDVFRASRLTYVEIGDTRAAAAPLLDAGWLDARPNLSLDELQRLLTKAELAQYFRLPWRDRTRRKADLLASLRGQCSDPRPFEGSRMGSHDSVLRLLAAPLLERFRCMFFGNFRQQWSEFVLSELGIFAYERIDSPLRSRPFRTRADIEAFEQLHRCRELLHAEAPMDGIAESMPPPIVGCEWLEERRQRLLFQMARRYERSADTTAATAVYSECSHPGARIRLIRLHERADRWDAARELCLHALRAPEDEAERQQLERVLPRLNRKLGRTSTPAARGASASAARGAGAPAENSASAAPERPPAVPSFDLCLEKTDAAQAVERQVRDFLARQTPAATAHYVENGLVTSLFGLLCWRAIFAPVAGAFFHDFHRGPADLFSGQFYRRREREFADCLAEFDSPRYAATIRETYAKKRGVQSPFVKWHLVNRSLLERALECFPAQHLKRWFEWILRDVQLNRTGFPDLVQFWPQERRYRLVEVKAPGDRLQDNQRRLLEFCVAHAMPVSVCNVRWA